MVIYLSHPVHGRKVAISEQEAEYDCTNGWIRYTMDTPAPTPAAPDTVKRKYTLKLRSKEQ